MRRTWIVAFAILSLCALLLTGCHGSQAVKQFEVPEAFDTTRDYEITFWAKNDTNKAQSDIYRNSIEEFQKIYPNVKVNLRLYTDYVKLYNDVITNIATGTTPNICITYPDHVATYLTGNNVVVPLDDLFHSEKYGFGGSDVGFDGVANGEMIPQFLEEGKFGGHYYALPFMRSTEVCYINRDLVEALGYKIPEVLTWDFVWEVSEAATKKAEDGTYLVNGQKVMIPFIYKSTDNMMIQYLRQKGIYYSNAEGDILLFNEGTKEFLYEISTHVKSGAFSTFKISSYPGNFLNAGQCIFAIDSTAGSTWIGSDAPLSDISEDKIVRFTTEVRMIPQVHPESPSMISQGPSLCLFNKEDDQEVLASWMFMQYLLTNEVQIPYSETEGYVPVTRTAQESTEYKEYLSLIGKDNNRYYDVKIKSVNILLENTKNTFTTPVFNGSASLRDAAGQLIEEVAKNTKRKKEINEDFMKNTFHDVSSLYRLDQIGRQTGRQDLGELPGTAKGLLLALGAAWIGIAIYALAGRKRR